MLDLFFYSNCGIHGYLEGEGGQVGKVSIHYEVGKLWAVYVKKDLTNLVAIVPVFVDWLMSS